MILQHITERLITSAFAHLAHLLSHASAFRNSIYPAGAAGCKYIGGCGGRGGNPVGCDRLAPMCLAQSL